MVSRKARGSERTRHDCRSTMVNSRQGLYSQGSFPWREIKALRRTSQKGSKRHSEKLQIDLRWIKGNKRRVWENLWKFQRQVKQSQHYLKELLGQWLEPHDSPWLASRLQVPLLCWYCSRFKRIVRWPPWSFLLVFVSDWRWSWRSNYRILKD